MSRDEQIDQVTLHYARHLASLFLPLARMAEDTINTFVLVARICAKVAGNSNAQHMKHAMQKLS